MEHVELDELSPEQWQRVVGALEPVMKDMRASRMREVLRRRRDGIHIVLENIPFTYAQLLRPSYHS